MVDPAELLQLAVGLLLRKFIDGGIGHVIDNQADVFDLAPGIHQRNNGAVLIHVGSGAGNRAVMGKTEQVRALLPGGEGGIVQDENRFCLVLKPVAG